MHTILALFAVALSYRTVHAEENVYNVNEVKQWHDQFQNMVKKTCEYFDDPSNSALENEVKNAKQELESKLKPAIAKAAQGKSQTDGYIDTVCQEYVTIGDMIVEGIDYLRQLDNPEYYKEEKDVVQSYADGLEPIYEYYLNVAAE